MSGGMSGFHRFPFKTGEHQNILSQMEAAQTSGDETKPMYLPKNLSNGMQAARHGSQFRVLASAGQFGTRIDVDSGNHLGQRDLRPMLEQVAWRSKESPVG